MVAKSAGAVEEKINILLIDNSSNSMLSLVKWLEGPDRNIIHAYSGNEALQLMLEYDFSLVILDVYLPEMNGFEVAHLMRRNERTKDIPIIFLTGIEQREDLAFRDDETGAVDYLNKPFVPEILRSKVDVFINL